MQSLSGTGNTKRNAYKSVQYQQTISDQNSNVSNAEPNWSDVPDSSGATSKITKGGYASGNTVQFRARLILAKNRVSDWVYSAPVRF